MASESDNRITPAAGGTWSTEVYDELRRLAAAKLAREHAGTLQATALVHDAWLRMREAEPRWQNRAHFFGAAAEAMRRILIDRARSRAAARHGGGQTRVDLHESQIIGGAPDDELLAVHEALDAFAEKDPAKAELVKLRYFAGLTMEQAAEVLGISLATAHRHWAFARAWLYQALKMK